MSTAEQRDSVRWMRTHDPAALARDAVAQLRVRARTGDAVAAITLRSLGIAVQRPTAKGKKKGLGAVELANYLKLSVVFIRNGRSRCEHSRIRNLILKLPERPSLDFKAWFDAAWELYLLSGDPMEDEAIADLARGAANSGKKPVVRIRELVRRAALRHW